MTTTLAQIDSADWSLMLDSIAGGGPGSGIGRVVEGLDDVSQCIAIILTTPKGSDPLRPTFGANLWGYVDYPIDAARANVVREVTEAITRWEPRVEVLSVSATPLIDARTQSGAHLSVSAKWRLKLGQSAAPAPAPQTTTVALAG